MAKVDSPIIRRLTRTELQALREGSDVNLPGAAAVIMATKMNPRKKALKPTQESDRPEGAAEPAGVQGNRLSLPVSTTAYTSPDIGLPRRPIPIYNSVTLFPDIEKRQILISHLAGMLQTERRVRSKSLSLPRQSSASKASHGYLINLDPTSTKGASTTSLLIALWRMRLWHGEGWTSGATTALSLGSSADYTFDEEEDVNDDD
ncbi:hypothetical protein CALVIDRAFT_324830 [Calocera viscosa TUFC12733]|uniref:Uncharacterized protein n=1 Tax=Calocera viscosa (strain TUFC12733) TaxID=1330018 RepID=A0A167QSH4_CALVF|nr:hypothetical protein CALVIDRAFT_324830 [Calocera viscosa TUFC12733]